MEALAAAGNTAANAGNTVVDKIDLSMLMGGSESGILPSSASSLAGVGSILGLDEAWKNDPRALWSSFVMIIVSAAHSIGTMTRG